MDRIEIDLGPLTEFSKELRQLPSDMKDKLLRGAAKLAVAAIHSKAVARAPILKNERDYGAPPGNLKASIYYMRVPELCTATVEAWKVDVRKGKGKWKHKRNQGKQTNTHGAYYGGFVEFGHWTATPSTWLKYGPGTQKANRAAWQASGKAKWVPAQPFMLPALKETQPLIPTIMGDYVRRNLPEVLRQYKVLKNLTVT